MVLSETFIGNPMQQGGEDALLSFIGNQVMQSFRPNGLLARDTFSNPTKSLLNRFSHRPQKIPGMLV